MRVARKHSERRWDKTATVVDKAIYKACQSAMFAPILNKIGFDQLEIVICGGAPLAPDTTALWQMYGVNVVEVYGQSEKQAASLAGKQVHFHVQERRHATGRLAVRLNDDGEILCTIRRLRRLLANDIERALSKAKMAG
jgi:long-chain acyl-CoA synthetase